jgi:hypothetical protein
MYQKTNEKKKMCNTRREKAKCKEGKEEKTEQ